MISGMGKVIERDIDRRSPDKRAALVVRMSPTERAALDRAAAERGTTLTALALDALAPYLPAEHERAG